MIYMHSTSASCIISTIVSTQHQPRQRGVQHFAPFGSAQTFGYGDKQRLSKRICHIDHISVAHCAANQANGC